MKKIILMCCMMLFAFAVNAQVNQNVKKDTVKLDSTQMEKINNMPMDTTHMRIEKMPNAKDTMMHKKDVDDLNPKKKD
jgi:PBP1b-binding outer membrane lipoprotein LpoB